MADPVPSIVLVHGAWHTPFAYEKFISALDEVGFEVHCPLLPTSNGSRPPQASLADDVAAVRTIVQSLVEASKQVLVIMHSYGGVPGSNALHDLSTCHRAKMNLPGGVVHLVYMCAYILLDGGSVTQVVTEAGFGHLWDVAIDEADDGSIFPRDPTQLLYGGVNSHELETILSQLVRTPKGALEAESKYEAWRDIPSTYIFTSEDLSVPPIYQQLMTDKVKASGVVLGEHRYETSHSPFLTKTKEMVQLVQQVVAQPIARATLT
ncbi:MAG: hypothetical protein Q9191_007544 [Dirinaria sp. TL-2023a]